MKTLTKPSGGYSLSLVLSNLHRTMDVCALLERVSVWVCLAGHSFVSQGVICPQEHSFDSWAGALRLIVVAYHYSSHYTSSLVVQHCKCSRF